MTAQMTYTSLVAAIEAWLDRSDAELIANIPQFIKNAEVRITRELRVLPFVNAATSACVAGTAIVAKPANWLETVSINVGTGTGNNTRNAVLPRSYDYLRSYWPDPSQTGVPKYYADYDLDHWLIAPTPASNYPFEVNYYRKLQGLDANNQTNALTDYAPDMLLYACLLESAPYLKNDERVATWQARYDRCLQAEVMDDVRLLIDRQIKASENKP
jgi:hypothetical protein